MTFRAKSSEREGNTWVLECIIMTFLVKVSRFLFTGHALHGNPTEGLIFFFFLFLAGFWKIQLAIFPRRTLKRNRCSKQASEAHERERRRKGRERREKKTFFSITDFGERQIKKPFAVHRLTRLH